MGHGTMLYVVHLVLKSDISFFPSSDAWNSCDVRIGRRTKRNIWICTHYIGNFSGFSYRLSTLQKEKERKRKRGKILLKKKLF